jgi:hypothetical protein
MGSPAWGAPNAQAARAVALQGSLHVHLVISHRHPDAASRTMTLAEELVLNMRFAIRMLKVSIRTT